MSPTVLGMASSKSATGAGTKATMPTNSKESINEKIGERLDLLPVQDEGGGGDPVGSNLTIPVDTFLKAAISLKDQVVKITWQGRQLQSTVVDPTVYTGLLGTAFVCFRSYLLTGCHQDLLMCGEIIETCTDAARSVRHLTFLCGRGGVYALGSVAFNYLGDQKRRDQYLDLFLEVASEKALPVGPEGGLGMSYDLLYGRAGFLWAALFIQSHIQHAITSTKLPDDLLTPVVEAVLSGGRAGSSDNVACPLMYRWHGTCYYGAANGLAGILHVLLHFPLSQEDADDVKQTLRYMMSKRFPGSGNYPSHEGNPRDKLVQWSHGATSMAITLAKASEVFPGESDFRDGAIEAGEVVWKNGLVQKVGLADGTAGTAYAFLTLYRLTGEVIYEERAKALATFLYHNTSELMKSKRQDAFTDPTDHAYSLFLGLGGVACLWLDLLNPDKSRFPGYEL